MGRHGDAEMVLDAARTSGVTRPRFWRIHLSSAMVVMIAAAVLLGVNLTKRSAMTHAIYASGIHEVHYTARGWPYSYESPEGNMQTDLEAVFQKHEPPEAASSHCKWVVCYNEGPYPYGDEVLVNIIIGLVALFVLWLTCEALIHWRSRKTI